MDLFSLAQQDNMEQPLAVRMRPNTLEEFIGQSHIVGEKKLLRKAIESDKLTSIILYGPPGTGKTTLAHIISETTKAEFVKVSATSTGVSELKKIIEKAKDSQKFYSRKTILFIDEIQRLNKGQQDILLPAVEVGHVLLIGATTENPYFEVNGALLSRSRIFQLNPLTEEDLWKVAQRALTSEKGLARFSPEITKDALEHLIRTASGDARVMLNSLEFAVLTVEPNDNGIRLITLEMAEDAIQAQRVKYDKTGDNHYDTISAFIKSMRGSDPDAALYWFARMLYANEDPRFIVRRIIVHASEDVGIADPTAMLVAQAAANALEWLGMPEARIPIAQAIIHIATAPKSNSVVQAVDQAITTVENTQGLEVPTPLRDSHYSGAKKMGHGIDYKYPHDYQNHYVKQQYMPAKIEQTQFYHPSNQGREKSIADRLKFLRQK